MELKYIATMLLIINLSTLIDILVLFMSECRLIAIIIVTHPTKRKENNFLLSAEIAKRDVTHSVFFFFFFFFAKLYKSYIICWSLFSVTSEWEVIFHLTEKGMSKVTELTKVESCESFICFYLWRRKK